MWAGLLLLTLGGPAPAQNAVAPGSLARSVSGQFVVVGRPARSFSPTADGLIRDGKLLKLEPAYAVVSCERIRGAMEDVLGRGGQWRGKIYISLHSAESSEDEITCISERFRDGWNYRLNVPNPVDPEHFMRAVVQAILLERANRNASAHSAELPLWLSEGVLREVLAARGPQVLLAPPELAVNRLVIRPMVVDTRRTNSVTQIRASLGERGPMSLDDLSWPKENQLGGPDAEWFRCSAQLFVAELCRFPQGRSCFQSFLEELPGHYNWQTAFLQGFKPYFEQPIDVDRWWTLQMASPGGAGASWSVVESSEQLEKMVWVAAESRETKTNLPTATAVSLATVFRDWPFERQQPALLEKLKEFGLARQKVAAEYIPLVDEYRKLISSYLDRRDRPEVARAGNKMNSLNTRALALETLRQFNLLEQARERMRPTTPPTTATSP